MTQGVEPEGLGKKTRILDTAETGGPEIESLRELWAMQCNEALERHQKAARIDHRSYERQGRGRNTTPAPWAEQERKEALRQQAERVLARRIKSTA